MITQPACVFFSCMWLYLTVTVSVFADACVFCMHVFNYAKCPMHVYACVFWMFWGGYMHTQNTEVGNILMSTAKEQEIGNTFKSLALRTVFRSQAKSRREPSIACDRVHRGIALYPLPAKQQSGEVRPI